MTIPGLCSTNDTMCVNYEPPVFYRCECSSGNQPTTFPPPNATDPTLAGNPISFYSFSSVLCNVLHKQWRKLLWYFDSYPIGEHNKLSWHRDVVNWGTNLFIFDHFPSFLQDFQIRTLLQGGQLNWSFPLHLPTSLPWLQMMEFGCTLTPLFV